MKNLFYFVLSLLMLSSCSREEMVSESTKDIVIRFDEKDITIIKKDGKYYLSDDILITEEQFQLLQNKGNENSKSVITSEFVKLWPNGEVPYVISPGFPDSQRITEAINRFSSNSGIRLIPRTNQYDYVEFIRSNVSQSYVGRVGGKQLIEISDFAGYGTIMHEIGHAIGLGHEHQRPDRNSYIWVNPALVSNNNYQVLSPLKFTNIGTMDYGSIMMYPSGSDMHKLSDGTGWDAQRTGQNWSLLSLSTIPLRHTS